jgi:hypothetical protein
VIYDFGPQAADRAGYLRYDGRRRLLVHGRSSPASNG